MRNDGGKPKTIVLGIGNTIRGDDGVGIRVAEECRYKIDQSQVTVAESSVAGLRLLDLLAGYEKVIIIDAIHTIDGKPGDIYRVHPETFQYTRHLAFPHDVSLANALQIGRRVGLVMPDEIVIFAIEVADTDTFCEDCTPAVRQAIPLCVEMILQELNANSLPYSSNSLP